MAKKLVVESFKGERPRVPDDGLPDDSASVAINTRLSNGEIRAYPQVEVSTDSNSALDTIVTGGYTNFFKASIEDAINWMSWMQDAKVSVLEVRYNDISAYEFPAKPTVAIIGGELAVQFAGRYVTNVGSGEDDWQASFTRGAIEAGVNPGLEYPFNQFVTASVAEELDTITSYLWEFQSGDATILPSGTNVAEPEFTTQLAFPAVRGIQNANSRTAVWRCTINDASGNTGYKDITISFRAWLFNQGVVGDEGDSPYNEDYYNDEF